jgi:adenine-specific DNA methylase
MAEGEYRKKLIEVALPLDAINREAAREKLAQLGGPRCSKV